MEFVCGNCSAKYMVSDDKVGSSGLKVRCRKCSAAIEVLPPGYLPERAEDPVVSSSDLGEAVDIGELMGSDSKSDDENLLGIDEDELGAVFDEALGVSTEPTVASEEVESPIIVDPIDDDGEETQVDPELAPDGWYIGLDDQQLGPFALERLKEMWKSAEIGPDALCWRDGMGDWVPISTIKPLFSAIAPQVPRPIVMGTARWGESPPASSAPTSPFRVSTLPQPSRPGLRGEPPIAQSGDFNWKPSAGSALASLVKEEMQAITNPTDASTSANSSFGSPSRFEPPPTAPRFQSISEGGGAAATAYKAPSSGRFLIVGASVAVGALVLALIGVVFWVVSRPPTVVVTAPPETPAASPAIQGQVPSGQATQVPPDGGLAAEAAPSEGGAGSQKAKEGGARRDRERAPPRASGDRKQSGEASRDSTPSQNSPRGQEADDFDTVFGGGRKTEKPKETNADKPLGGYIPPAPGQGSVDIKDTLGRSDIMEVVLASKTTLQKCVDEQHIREPNVPKGTLLMQWTILTSGKVTKVQVLSEGFKDSYIAGCMSGVISGWVFPRHLVQGEPIKFPFKF